MTSTELAQRLESRWERFKLGTVAALPITALMTLFWIYYDFVALAWFVLYPWWSGLGIFHKTPVRKTISSALFLATMVSFAIWYWALRYPR